MHKPNPNNPAIWDQFRCARNQANNAIKLAKKLYVSDNLEANKGNLRKTWNVINELTSRNSGKSTNILEIKVDNKIAKNPAIQRTSDPAIHRSSDPAILRSSDPAIQRSSDLAIQRSSDPAIQRSSDPAIQRSSDLAIQRSSDPAI